MVYKRITQLFTLIFSMLYFQNNLCCAYFYWTFGGFFTNHLSWFFMWFHDSNRAWYCSSSNRWYKVWIGWLCWYFWYFKVIKLKIVLYEIQHHPNALEFCCRNISKVFGNSIGIWKYVKDYIAFLLLVMKRNFEKHVYHFYLVMIRFKFAGFFSIRFEK